jgi:hypothetical protein
MPLWPALPLDLTSGVFAFPFLLVQSYLDPSMGSYALQILLATLFGGMFAMKQSWGELKAWFVGRFGSLSGPGGASRDRQGIVNLTKESARPGAHGQSTAKIQ